MAKKPSANKQVNTRAALPLAIAPGHNPKPSFDKWERINNHPFAIIIFVILGAVATTWAVLSNLITTPLKEELGRKNVELAALANKVSDLESSHRNNSTTDLETRPSRHHMNSILDELRDRAQFHNLSVSFSSRQFEKFLEKVTPLAAKSSSPLNRERYLSLLLKVAQLPESSREWEEADSVLKLMQEIDSAGWEILDPLKSCGDCRATIIGGSTPSHLYLSDQPFENPEGFGFPIMYAWPIVEDWAYRLINRRLLYIASSDARGGFHGISISPLGRLIFKWCYLEPRT